MKQNLYMPYPVENQVVLMYAGTNGFIDEYPESALIKYEREMLAYMEKDHADTLKSIREKGAIEPATEEALGKALTQFKEIFTY